MKRHTIWAIVLLALLTAPADCTSSLTQTTLKATFQSISNGTGQIAQN